MSLKKYANGWESIPYKKGDKIVEIFSINGPVYIVEKVDSQIIKTQCGIKLIKHSVRPLGYCDEWIKWSMSVKTL